MKIYVDRKGPGDPGDKLSVKIKLFTDRRPHLPEIQHIVMQIKQGGPGSAGRPTAASGEPAGLAAGTPLRGPAGRRWLRVGASLPGHTLRPARSARPPGSGPPPGSEWRCGCSEAAGTPTPSSLGGTGGAGQRKGWVRWASRLWGGEVGGWGAGGERGQRGSSQAYCFASLRENRPRSSAFQRRRPGQTGG